VIDLDYADKLMDMNPEAVAIELMALAVAVKFDRRRFIEATRFDTYPGDPVMELLFHETLKGYAQAWREHGDSSLNGELDEAIYRWQVIVA
jgi:hypothetical protein